VVLAAAVGAATHLLAGSPRHCPAAPPRRGCRRCRRPPRRRPRRRRRRGRCCRGGCRPGRERTRRRAAPPAAWSAVAWFDLGHGAGRRRSCGRHPRSSGS
jgi:hypothetical protein